MDLMEELDPEQARAIIDPALEIMIDAALRYDGYIVQSTGDGIFALFGAPVAHEDHPHRALLAGLKMQEDMRRYSARLRESGDPPVEVRIGVNTGDAVVRTIRTGEMHTEYTPIGHSTSLAARMQALAPTGSIAVTENVRRLVEGYFELKALGPARVKGLSEPIEIYQVVGLGPLRTRLQASQRRGLSKFVGRDAEIAQIGRALALAREGRGQIVAAVGEAGVGKSRLFHEFKAVSHAGCMTLETFSVSHGKASAYLPLIDLLKNYFEIAPEDDERKRRERIGGKVLMLDRALEDTLPYLFSILGVAEANDPIAEMDPEIRRRRTLDAIKRLLLRESLDHPLIVIFEDLHWVDDETQVFLNLFADSIASARILMLVNYRPEYRHDWQNKSNYAQLRLDPLGRESAESLLGALVGGEPELTPLKRLIVERTEGNPFFMEETVQEMFEDGVLVRNGKVRLARPLSAIQIPPGVKGILAARIDRLSPPQKDLLQTLAIIGKEFPLGLVRQVVAREERELVAMLSDLQVGEFIYEQPAFPDTEYVFKHALTQEVAYDSVLGERRKLIHEKTAQALEEIYASQIEDHLPALAYHLSRSANAEKAVAYLIRAAEQARAQSAYGEAIEKLTTAAAMLASLPQTPEHDHQEIRVRALLGQALSATRGFSAPELQNQISRVEELVARVTDPGYLYVGLFSLWSVEFSRANLPRAQKMATRLLELALADENAPSHAAAAAATTETATFTVDVRKGSALSLLGTTQLWRGRARESLANLQHAADLFDRDLEALLGSPIAPVVPNRTQLAWALWIAGYPDQALKRSNQAIDFATRLGRPFSMAFALQYAVQLAYMRRDDDAIRRLTESLCAVADESGFPMFAATGLASKGRMMIKEGNFADGIAMMREGVTHVRDSGGELVYRYLLVLMADACLSQRAVDEGLRALDAASERIEDDDERIMECEIHRLRAELMLSREGNPGAAQQAAEELFRKAITLAAERGARSWELRAALSLGRLMIAQGQREAAREILAPIYGRFTEGFDTSDLKDARELLAQKSA